MSTLVAHASSGSLTAGLLDGYLQTADCSIVDKPGVNSNLTPLAAAVVGGHLHVVELLLKNQANPDAPSTDGRTPLLLATSRKLPRNQAAIVSLLLAYGADVNISDSSRNRNTPLMNAIVQLHDPIILRQLVDKGADVKRTNAKGKSAEDLAKQYGMEYDIRPRAERNAVRGYFIDLLVAVVLFIIAIVDSGAIMTVKGEISRLLGISGNKHITAVEAEVFKEIGENIDASIPVDDTREKDCQWVAESAPITESRGIESNVPSPITVEALEQGLDQYIEDSNLKTFFQPGDSFLKDLARKAAELPSSDVESVYNKEENMKRLTRLSLYQPVIYCDDSGSMASDNRYQYQTELVTRIARIATKILPDDCRVELRFINNNSRMSLSADEIAATMRRVRPDGVTMLGTNLRDKILDPLVYRLIENGQPLKRPLLICTITDGYPWQEPQNYFKSMIVECRRRLLARNYDSTAVKFLVSQIGDEPGSENFLLELRADNSIEDMVHCTSDRLDEKFEEFKGAEDRLEEWLLKILTSPIMNWNSN